MLEFLTSQLSIIGRGLALLLLVAALLMPGDRGQSDSHAVILVDQSDRIDPEQVAQEHRTLLAHLNDIDANMNISSVPFGNTGNAATASDALLEALWQLGPLQSNSVILISDGFWDSDVATLLKRTRDADIPVFWLPLESHSDRARFIDIDAPSSVRANQKLRVSITAEAIESANYEVDIYANGIPVGRESMPSSGRLAFSLSAPESGVLRLGAALIDTNTGLSVDRDDTGALVNVVATPRLLVLANHHSPIADSLSAGGWSVTQLTPREFARRQTFASAFNGIVLDDVAATDMPAEAWIRITDAVQRNAVGLLVLGGPNSFGLGAYRESILEEVLPVISEPPENESPVSVVFLVDISGSMGRQKGGALGLRSARDAVLFSAAALRPADRVGLIAFDVEAQQLLMPAGRDDHAAAIRNVWPQRASGGTSISSALDLAMSALAKETTEQKLLLLVTDGMLSPSDLGELRAKISLDDLEFIAIVVSDEKTSEPLSRLDLGDRASLLMIDDVLRLPTLMRDEVESRRAAVVPDRSVALERLSLPIAGEPFAWPSVDAYQLTRARPEATVALTAENGEPLMAAWTAGTGRVVAMTGGLNGWSADWLKWSDWPRFATGLINYIAVTNNAASRPVVMREASNRVAITLDAEVTQGNPATLLARLAPPNGPVVDLSFVPEAPGRYRALYQVDQLGEYKLVWEDAGGVHRHSFFLSSERTRSLGGKPIASRYLDEGLLGEWGDEAAAEVVRQISYRSTLIALALLMLLATIAGERIPMTRHRLSKMGVAPIKKRPQ